MLSVSKESLAPNYYDKLRQAHRSNADALIPEMVFCLFLSGGIRKRIGLEQIAMQATMTYPSDFHTWVDGHRVPDLAIMLLALNEAATPECQFVIGNWSSGWHLTRKGLRFAKDVERRLRQRGN